MAKKGNPVDSILAAAKTRRRGGHSPIYEWFWSHYQEVAPELTPPRTPNWAAMAKQFGAEGILDGLGKEPTATTVRQTFWRVQRDKQAKPSKRKPRGKSAAPLVQSVEPAQSAPIAEPPPDRGNRPRQQFSVVKPKGST